MIPTHVTRSPIAWLRSGQMFGMKATRFQDRTVAHRWAARQRARQGGSSSPVVCGMSAAPHGHAVGRRPGAGSHVMSPPRSGSRWSTSATRWTKRGSETRSASESSSGQSDRARPRRRRRNHDSGRAPRPRGAPSRHPDGEALLPSAFPFPLLALHVSELHLVDYVLEFQWIGCSEGQCRHHRDRGG